VKFLWKVFFCDSICLYRHREDSIVFDETTQFKGRVDMPSEVFCIWHKDPVIIRNPEMFSDFWYDRNLPIRIDAESMSQD